MVGLVSGGIQAIAMNQSQKGCRISERKLGHCSVASRGAARLASGSGRFTTGRKCGQQASPWVDSLLVKEPRFQQGYQRIHIGE